MFGATCIQWSVYYKNYNFMGFWENLAKIWSSNPPPGDGAPLTGDPGSDPDIASRCTPVGENGVSSGAGSGRPLPSLTGS